MFDSDKWIEILHVLSKNKARTVLTGLGVFTGIFILMILLASSEGLSRGVLGEFGEVSKNSFFIWRGQTTMAYKGFNPGRTVRPYYSDAKLLEREIDEIRVSYPRCGGFSGTQSVIRNGISEGFTIKGDLPGVYSIDPMYTVKGRFLNDFDVSERRKVAVIGQRVYEVLFDDNEDPIGKYIQLNGAFFQVIGVMDTYSSGDEVEKDHQSVYIPISTYQNLFKTGRRVSYIFVNVKDEFSSTEILKKSFEVLGKKHHIHPNDEVVFGSFDLGHQFAQIVSLFTSIGVLMWVVGIGTLLSGVIGVSNIMLIVVKERTQEFGIMRAIGATPKTVIAQLLLESGVLTTVFGVLGFMTGILTIESGLLELFFINPESDFTMFKNPQVNFSNALISLLLVIVFGMLAGLLPAARAVKIRPVEALQS